MRRALPSAAEASRNPLSRTPLPFPFPFLQTLETTNPIQGMGEDCCSTQLVDANGVFIASAVENFVKTTKLAQCGINYAVVSIMGPQSSGKSTLLNHLFHTNFKEMDASKGRIQVTTGIWIAKCIGIEPFTIVMDLEGTDGRDRGEDDTTFERQSALFALAISDIVLINMWCHDIGREHAANRPLLKTVFQVMMRFFSPRKTTLLFVIRDKTKTPLEHLDPILRKDIQTIWDTVSKPQAHKDTPLNEFFRVEVTALSNYEEKEKQFKDEVRELRQRFFHSIAPGGLAGDRLGVIPASGFSFSAQQIWKVIRENKDLDLPALKVMVATVRCEEIANEKLHCLTSDERWLELKAYVQSGPVPGFGKKLSSIIDGYLSEYAMETVYFDEHVRTAKQQQLESKALQLVQPAYKAMLGHLRSRSLFNFKHRLEQSLKRGELFAASVHNCSHSCMLEFDQGCVDAAIKHANWDTSKVREKLRRDIEAHALSVCNMKLSEMIADHEKQLTEALAEPIESLFDAAGQDTWASIRKLLMHETEVAMSGFSTALSDFELDQETSDKMLENLAAFARRVVEKKAREEAGKVLIRMKDRFLKVFTCDIDSLPRVWTGKEDIRAITKDARAVALKLLSVLAAIRLDEKSDKIEHVLFRSLLDGTSAVSGARDRSVTSTLTDPLAASTWEEVPPKDMLITPVQCKSLWRQFEAETEFIISQAISAQEATRHGNNQMPPPWAIVAMVMLGFNEFMLLLKNPLYLVAFFIIFLLLKALWVRLDIPGEFQNGTVSGMLALSARFLPTVMNLLKRIADKGQMRQNPEPPRWAPSSLSSQTFRSQTQRLVPMTGSVLGNSSSSPSKASSSESGIDYSSSLRHRQFSDKADCS